MVQTCPEARLSKWKYASQYNENTAKRHAGMQKLLHHSKYNPYQVFLHQPENGLFLHLCFYIAIRNITFDKWHTEIEPWSHSLLWNILTKPWNYVPFPVEQPQSEYINFMSAIKHERAKIWTSTQAVKEGQVRTWSSGMCKLIVPQLRKWFRSWHWCTASHLVLWTSVWWEVAWHRWWSIWMQGWVTGWHPERPGRQNQTRNGSKM